MLWGKSHDIKIALLEQMFGEFQNRMEEHMEDEESARGDIKDSLKDVISHIDIAQKNNVAALNEMKGDVLQLIDKEYASKLYLHGELTSLRQSILEDIVTEKKRSAKELWLLFIGFCACLTLVGWLYVNVIKKDSHIKPIIISHVDNIKRGFNDDKISNQ